MIIIGDALIELKKLEPESVNCCVTSPPYFGLRDYGHENQIGLEATPGEYVKNMVEIFREVKRVLRNDGSLWLNLGDSYSGGDSGPPGKNAQVGNTKKGIQITGHKTYTGLPPKNLIGIPWKVAFALQEDGWYLRQDIIWHKPNPMPESVKDRCTKAHEYIFLLSKSPKYYFDHESIKEPSKYPGDNRKARQKQKDYDSMLSENGQIKAVINPKNSKTYPKRNKRSVWTVPTKPYKGAHFATFPPDLIEPCVLSGCPESGIVLDPFGGSGTVGQVARENGRDFILIELNPDYKPLIDQRIARAYYQKSF